MPRLRLTWKLLAAFALVTLATALVIGALAIPSLVRAEEVESEKTLLSHVARLKPWAVPVLAGREDEGAFRERMATPSGHSDVRMTVIAPDGRVVADSEHDATSMDDHSDRPEIQDARRLGTGVATRHSATLGTRMMYAAERIGNGDAVLGYVRASQTLRAIGARTRAIRDHVLGATLAAILISLAIAFLVSRRLTRPLRSLTHASLAFGHGQYDTRVPVESSDELGRLGETFNRMAKELQRRIETISRDRSELLAILTGMTEGVVATDRERRVVLMNIAAGQMVGEHAADAVGKRIWEVTRIPEVSEVVAAALEQGRQEEEEVRIPGAKRDRFMQLVAAPVKSEAGEVTGAVLVLHDISELRHLEHVRRDFVANVSHELKTPLAAIRGFAETILEDDEMDAGTRRRFLERVRKQAVRLTDLVEEVLALSRLESDSQAVPMQRVDAAACIREACATLSPLAEERRIQVVPTIPDGTVEVRGDEEAIRRLATNLLDNALKYTPSGGTVWVRLEVDAESVHLRVEDTGIGIPLEARERVFERFYRVDPGRSRAAGGTGLGLAIVKHLVQALGGRVWVEEGDEGGSRFCVQLPRAHAHGSAARR